MLSTQARAWIEDLHRRDYAPRTVLSYRYKVRAVEATLGPLVEVQPAELVAYLDARNVTGRTRYQWVSTLHGFYAWAMRHGLADSDPTTMMDRPRTHAGLPRPIGDDDLAYAVTVADAQMRAWLACGALAGMRVGEIAGLKRPDVIEGRSRLRILGKGRRERVVPLHPALLEALRAAGLPRTGPVFTRPGGGPWSGAAVSRRMAGFFHDLGIDATAHQLRHWFATQTYAGCGDLLVVQNLLGHSSPTTTAVYTAWSRPAADAAVEALALPR